MSGTANGQIEGKCLLEVPGTLSSAMEPSESFAASLRTNGLSRKSPPKHSEPFSEPAGLFEKLSEPPSESFGGAIYVSWDAKLPVPGNRIACCRQPPAHKKTPAAAGRGPVINLRPSWPLSADRRGWFRRILRFCCISAQACVLPAC